MGAERTIIFGSDSADRILAIVHKLQQRVENCKAEFQLRLKNEIIERERTLREQLRAESEQAMLEAQDSVRQTVTRELLGRFHIEESRLQLEFERLQHQAVESAEASANARVQESQESLAQIKEQAHSDAVQWNAEKQRYMDRIVMLERASAPSPEELDRRKDLELKLEEAMLAKAQLGLDLQRVISELNAGARSKAQDERDNTARGEVATIVQSEMARVQLLVDDLENRLADPTIDLPAEIRLNRERSELRAYLNGLRYSLGEVTLQTPVLEDEEQVSV